MGNRDVGSLASARMLRFRRLASKAVYSNDQGAPPVKTSYLDNFERLAAVKQKFDPASLFRVNHNVRSSVDFGLAALHDIPAAVSLNNVVPCPALS
jgi:hypothetical protein